MSSLAVSTTPIISQNELMLKMLTQFYKTEAHMSTMLEIITGKSRISLRIIDWFVTNYAKKNDTCYELPDGRRFNVYYSYKLKLKSNGKVRFDPFCRSERICLPYKENKGIETTIGQLNFFKWILENHMLGYIMEHYEDIENDMKKRGHISKKRGDSLTNPDAAAATIDVAMSVPSTASKTRKKREELSVSATKHFNRKDFEIVLKFN